MVNAFVLGNKTPWFLYYCATLLFLKNFICMTQQKDNRLHGAIINYQLSMVNAFVLGNKTPWFLYYCATLLFLKNFICMTQQKDNRVAWSNY